MPLALLAVGTGMSLAGTGMQIAGNSESQSAMNKARANSVAQQAALQKQSNDIAQKSIAGSAPQIAQQQVDQGAAARTNLAKTLQQAAAPIATAAPATGSAGAGKAGAAGNAWTNLVTGNQAKAGGYQDWQNQQAIKNADAGQKIGILNNFSQGDAALLPIEMQVASQKGDKLSGWGSLVSALGSVAMTGGAMGAGAGAGGVSAGQTSAMSNEFNGVGAAGMTGSGAAPVSPIVWANMYG